MSGHASVVGTLERLWQRIQMVVAVARITAVNDAVAAVQLIQAKLNYAEIKDSTPRLAEYGFTSVPFDGADAVLVFVNGDRSNGVIIATGDQRYRLSGLAQGEVALYDDQGQKIYISRGGIVISGATKPVTIENCSAVNVNGCTVTVTGGDVVADGISLKNHVHADDDGGDTGPAIG